MLPSMNTSFMSLYWITLNSTSFHRACTLPSNSSKAISCTWMRGHTQKIVCVAAATKPAKATACNNHLQQPPVTRQQRDAQACSAPAAQVTNSTRRIQGQPEHAHS
eukprot:1161956-Pelagomonas_calceolata.AAC.5